MKNIIKRLQDIDKLKIILFDKYQRKLFESIPKPGIGGKELRNGLSMLKMKNITGIRKYSNKEVLKTDMSYINLQKPMNQRLVDLISSIDWLMSIMHDELIFKTRLLYNDKLVRL